MVSVYLSREAAIKYIEINPDLLGGPDDNPYTEFDGEMCSVNGFPTYAVNTATLNLVVQDTEFSVQSLGPGLATTRTWNTNPTQAGMFGNGWSFPYESTIQKHCGGAAVKFGTGQGLFYTADLCPSSGSLSYPVAAIPPSGNFDNLTYTSDDCWLLKKKDTRETWRYDPVPSDNDSYRLTSITDRNGNALQVFYNESGAINKIKDAAGRELILSYADNRVTTLKTPDGGQITYDYDLKGNLFRTVDLFGTEILYEYDAENYMTAMSYAGKTIRYTYDTTGGWKHVATITDATGAVKTYAGTSDYSRKTVTDARGATTQYYSSNGQTTAIIYPSGASISTTYANGLPVTVKDPQGNTFTMAYDSRGNLTKKTDALGKSTSYTYDADDNLITVSNPLGEIWTSTYDNASNLKTMQSPAGRLTSFTYNAQGLLTGLTDANGHSTAYTYDEYGNLQTSTDALGHTTTFGYDSAGINRISAQDPKGNTSTFAYDQNRRLIRLTHPDGSHRDYSYDGCASTGFTDENGNRTVYTRDPMLRITGITDALNAVTANTYDGNGNLLSLTDPLQHTAGMAYDLDNRLTAMTDPLGDSIQFTNNKNGLMTALQDERLKQTAFAFDANSRLLSITDPLGRAMSITRDDLGRAQKQTNARGVVIETVYDSDGNIIEKTYDNVTAAVYAYDNASNLISFTDAGGTTTYTYNSRNEITGIIYSDNKTVAFTYDAAGNMASITYPGGLEVTYGYSSRNRVQTMQWDMSTDNFTYDPAGNMLSEIRSNGTSSEYMYDANNRIISIRHKKGSDTIAGMDYTRNARGDIDNESINVPVTMNLTDMEAAGIYNGTNQISTLGGSDYSYDEDGNLTGISGSRSFTAAYDPENRPTQMTSGTVTASFTYDALGNRIQAVRDSKTTSYYYDHLGRLLFETDGSGAGSCYLYNGRRLIAMRSAAGASYFYHYGRNGTTAVITDASGSTVNAYAYSAYGELVGSKETVANPFTYVGAYGVMDEGGGIYFMKNRYYDAVTGRFLQRDPIKFAGGQTNLYAYVGNNPVANIDPSGLLNDGSATMERFIQTPCSKEGFDRVTYIADKAMNFAPEQVGKLYTGIKVLYYISQTGDEFGYLKAAAEIAKGILGTYYGATAGLDADFIQDAGVWYANKLKEDGPALGKYVGGDNGYITPGKFGLGGTRRIDF